MSSRFAARNAVLLCLVMSGLWVASCSNDPVDVGPLVVEMTGIEDGGVLPIEHVGGELGGEDDSPEFRIKRFPRGTETWAFFVECSRSGGEMRPHFMVANLMATNEMRHFAKGYFNQYLSNRMRPTNGANGYTVFEHQGERIYHGPLADDRYLEEEYTVRFHFYALDAKLRLKDGFKRKDFERAARGAVLGEAVIQATFRVE